MTISLRERGVQVVLLDVEGTTTPISFVYDVLFPYARRHLRNYLRAHSNGIDDIASLLRSEHARLAAGSEAIPEWDENSREQLLNSIASFCDWLMDRDVKSPGLKLLQGRIWEQGYADGSIRGYVFPDVPVALDRWTTAGLRAAIYSSGSVLAQRLIFSHTQSGDLTPKLSAYFDTSVGGKKESPSYTRIAESLGVAPASVLFLSDVDAELMAAANAGLQVMLVVRPGNKPVPGSTFESLQSFDLLS